MEYKYFEKLSENFNIVPVYKKIAADLLTPVAAYLKIREEKITSFLLESVEGIGRLARYSFIGLNPSEIVSNYGYDLIIKSAKLLRKQKKKIYSIFLKEELRISITRCWMNFPISPAGLLDISDLKIYLLLKT